MRAVLDPDTAARLTDFVEKVGLLRRDMQHRKELEKYEARVARIEQKLVALADHLEPTDPAVARALRSVWQLPARSLAFRNAAHQKTLQADEHDRGGAMATFARHAEVKWTGGLMDGRGTASAGTGTFSLPVTFPSRIAETNGDTTTPEEFLAAAHAVCYTMVLANTIGKQGGTASQLRVTATVTAEKGDAGITVVSSRLDAVVEGLEGIARTAIQDLAVGAEKGCPISNAIRGSVTITVNATAP